MGDIMWVLTPRQQAHFYLSVEFHHKSVMQLKTMYHAMRDSLLNTSSQRLQTDTTTTHNNDTIKPKIEPES